MAATKSTTDLVGQKVRITGGRTMAETSQALLDNHRPQIKDPTSPSALWRNFGDCGVVRAVTFQGGDGFAFVQLDGSGIIEKFYLTHLTSLL